MISNNCTSFQRQYVQIKLQFKIKYFSHVQRAASIHALLLPPQYMIQTESKNMMTESNEM